MRRCRAGRCGEAQTLAALAAHDVLISASFIEGLPLVLIEAMALARPVIAPRVAGIPELVEDGVHDLLFAPAHWAELEAAIIRVADDAGTSVRWGLTGQQSVFPAFAAATAIKPLASLFKSAGRSKSTT